MPLQQHTTPMDERSFKRFVESYSNGLLRYVLYLVRSKEGAEEIVSDVFFEVWQNREKMSEIQNLKAWLITIAHNKTISYLRKAQSDASVSWDGVIEHAIPSDLQTPDEKLISQEEMSRINGIIKSLPPRCKQVLVLAKIERLPYKEIAEMLGISVKTINVHVAKALELIANGLNK